MSEEFVTPFSRTFGAIVDCDGIQYAVIANVTKDCWSDADVNDCAKNFRVSPSALPGGEHAGELSGYGLPISITSLEPLKVSDIDAK